MIGDRYSIKTKYLRVNVLMLGLAEELLHYRFETGEPPKEFLFVFYKNSKEFNNFQPYGRGGKTIVTIVDNETKQRYTGVAVCSMQDQFSYKAGRELALERAWSQVNQG